MTSVAPGNNGEVWFATGSGVSCFDGAAWRGFANGDVFGDNDIFTDMTVGKSGKVYLSDSSRLVVLDSADSTVTIIPSPIRGKTRTGSAIAFDSAGTLWFGAYGGIARLDGDVMTTVSTASPDVSRFITDIACGTDGVLWFARAVGALRFDGIDWRNITPLSNLYITAASPAPENAVWFGLRDGGAILFDGTERRDYLRIDALAGNIVNAITVDYDGTAWFATGGGVASFDGASWTLYTSDDGLPHDNALDIMVDGNNRVWVGTVGGVACR